MTRSCFRSLKACPSQLLYPVDSPYYLFDSLIHPLDRGWIYQMAHFASDHGGARGAAFPSTHVAVSTLILLAAWKEERRIGYLLVPLVMGVYVATIYGRFHYALDVVAGCCLAVIIYGAFRWSGIYADHEMPYRRLNE
jgi:membrane-associated phospholipid phosphatase